MVEMLDSRRGLYVAVGSGIAAVSAAGTLGALGYVNRAQITSVSPTPTSAIASGKAPISVALENAGSLKDLRLILDGKDITRSARVARGRLVAIPPKLADGPHVAEVRFSSDALISRTVMKQWAFEVDTKVPKLALKSPSALLLNRREVAVAGVAEPGAAIAASWGTNQAEVIADPAGAWHLTAQLHEGPNTLRLAARDRAGNATVVTRRLGIDTMAPRVVIDPIPGGILKSNTPVITGRVLGESPRALNFGGVINGTRVADVAGTSAVAIAASKTQDEVQLAGATTLAITGNRFTLTLPPLAEGRNRISVWASDGAGNRGSKKLGTIVDSTDDFGTRPIMIGARGADIKALQIRLKEAGLYRKGKLNGRFEAKTLKAVRGYQRRFDLKVTGEVEEPMLQKMIGRIVVDLSQRKLRLYRNGRVAKTYSVAVGQAAYPTPVGKYEVIQKEVDPTWKPPSSPWAKGLGPIPPGPGNPLGTRWIGTSADAVGIHGTYADSSIGTAASHGCIRMHIKDVEALYDDVALGMPVQFVA
jgi:peptidoglycan hydrolase-like protein with peptidoglycan-binding domain